ncbi:hypothetical protein ACFVZX_20830, partial [Streptomyces erythrochromogenes]
MTDEGHGRPAGRSDEDAASLPVLLEAVLSVGSELELRATLQHIVDSAGQLGSGPVGGGRGGGPRRRPARRRGERPGCG